MGPPGPPGPAGPAGPTGPAGADGITPAVNVLINGDFRINQRAYVAAAVLAAGVYGHDGWKAGAAGGDYSFTQLKSSTLITIGSGKSLIQPIEDANVAGGSYVLTWTGTAQARAGVNTLTPSGAYAASPLLITGQTAGTVMSVEFNAGTLGTVKLERGTTASPFVMRPIDQELQTCQRYYETTTLAINTTAVGSPYYETTWRVVKRGTPVITTSFDTGTGGSFYPLAGGPYGVYLGAAHSTAATATIRGDASL
jgi:hypothetical protein